MKIKAKSLSVTENKLKDPFFQLQVLNGTAMVKGDHIRFKDKLAAHGINELKTNPVEIFQINIGKLCNQVCTHCHVDAGPDKKVENMDKATLEMCLAIIKEHNIPKVDITGGAPEMNPHFRWFVEECTKIGTHVISRCNLTIIVANKKYYDIPEFYAKHKVEVVSSLPYFSKSRTDSQRGDGVFEASIKALKMLNEVGYGVEGSGLDLSLVYNPAGAFLPGDQVSLERQFKTKLKSKYDIVFNSLYCITNLPVSRFLDYLVESGNYDDYMNELVGAFNPSTVDGLMCKNTLSISWDGFIFDCDFNQMLDLKVASKSNHISNFDIKALENRDIIVNQHCYGCTAGSGSSCGGELV